MPQVGFGKADITPRVGVELCGFGPYRCRHSTGVRDHLWARAMAIRQEGRTVVLIGCDLIGTSRALADRVRRLIADGAGIPPEAVLVCSSHTHSGPNAGPYNGWGEADPPYLELLPRRIAAAGREAVASLREAELSHAEVPCEGIGLNREYDRDAPPLAEVLRDDWRPAKPELTDTTAHVLTATADRRLLGFVSYFGCHPVVCCAANTAIHGDYCGVATNRLEREHPGAIGLFIQGAQGDVNSCVVHKPMEESLLALDVIADRYANAIREGMRQARPVAVDRLSWAEREVAFSRKPWTLDTLRGLLAETETALAKPDATDADREFRMNVVRATALRRLVAASERGESLAPATPVSGARIGPVTILGSGFETMQAIKNDVKRAARGPVTWVASFVNDAVGYAPDRTAAARGGYAADVVPMICGALPFANLHDELVEALLGLDREL